MRIKKREVQSRCIIRILNLFTKFFTQYVKSILSGTKNHQKKQEKTRIYSHNNKDKQMQFLIFFKLLIAFFIKFKYIIFFDRFVKNVMKALVFVLNIIKTKSHHKFVMALTEL